MEGFDKSSLDRARISALRSKIQGIAEQLEDVKVLLGMGEKSLDELLANKGFELTTTEVAAIIGKDRSLVTQMAQAGLIPYARTRGRGGGTYGSYRFRGTDVARARKQADELAYKARKVLAGELAPGQYGEVIIDEYGLELGAENSRPEAEPEWLSPAEIKSRYSIPYRRLLAHHREGRIRGERRYVARKGSNEYIEVMVMAAEDIEALIE